MRRLTALLTSLLLLHLTLVGADLTCAEHGGGALGSRLSALGVGAQQVSRPDASSHDHHRSPTPSERTGDDEASCDVPTLPACCQALASCGVSIAGDASGAAGDLSHLATGILASAEDAPVSWALEPDPPPPKA